MSAPATPALTQMDEALQMMSEVKDALKVHADALNALGGNVQWIVDNVQGIFQMFNSPQFASMMPAMLGAAANAAGESDGN